MSVPERCRRCDWSFSHVPVEARVDGLCGACLSEFVASNPGAQLVSSRVEPNVFWLDLTVSENVVLLDAWLVSAGPGSSS